MNPPTIIRNHTANRFIVSKFSGARARDYDRDIRRLVPGYSALLELVGPVMLSEIGDRPANVLVAGAGTGAELVELAYQSIHWRVRGLDPSKDMLDVARRRAEHTGVSERTAFSRCALEDAHFSEPFAGATSLFVSHFMPVETGEKGAYLSKLAEVLEPGAPLLIADLTTRLFDLRSSYSNWLLDMSGDQSHGSQTLDRLASELHPLAPGQQSVLMSEVGFERPTLIFSALGIECWLWRKLERTLPAPDVEELR
ncbi:class I SAM-dependent methyltransferase [Maricaulis sp. MIT060901]|uniref:class I SAM-dependent methyltransferase n=1 Tax=Maricaulis sp. MIT060901 TaxID=3096993 RepID=UPI00399C3F38